MIVIEYPRISFILLRYSVVCYERGLYNKGLPEVVTFEVGGYSFANCSHCYIGISCYLY